MAEGEGGGRCRRGLGSSPALQALLRRGPARARVAEMAVPPGLGRGLLLLLLVSAAAVAAGPTAPARQEVLGAVFGL